MRVHPIKVDTDELSRRLGVIEREHIGKAGAEDVAHMEKMERWVKRCTGLGYATAWMCPNPLSALFLSTAVFGRWTVLAHHISHRAFDRCEEAPDRFSSKHWARGPRRRFSDWLDWIEPQSWHEEHNILHHYRLGEEADPDVVEHNLDWLRQAKVPEALRYAVSLSLATVWKPIYYAPAALKAQRQAAARRKREDVPKENLFNLGTWLPVTKSGRDLWMQSWLPYAGWKFGVVPLMYLPLSPLAVINVWLNTLMAEVLTNLHGFAVIVPNHAGDDLMRFDEPTGHRGEFYLRQIVGSVNFDCGSDVNDFLHGFLNYQIEHHIWPTATPLQLRRAQPHVKALCEELGIPYRQQHVAKRIKKLLDIMIGKTSMISGEEGLELLTSSPSYPNR